jgi:SH3-like domain-containing protein
MDKFQELEKLAELLSKGILTQEEFDERKQTILNREANSPLPMKKANMEKKTPAVPSKPFSEQIAPLLGWMKTNKKPLFIGISALLILFLGYKFFLKSDPEADGRTAAKAECGCKTENNKAIITAYDAFLNGFQGFGLKSRTDAQKKLQEIVEQNTKSVLECEEKAKGKYNSLKETYILQSEGLSEFENAYTAQKEVCTVEKEAEKNQKVAEVSKKIDETMRPIELKEAQELAAISYSSFPNASGSYSDNKFYITGTNVNLRSLPNINNQSNILTQIGFETEVNAVGESALDDRNVYWYKVNYNGMEGWVSSKFISTDKYFKQTWKKAGINDPDGYTNVRETANANAQVLTQIKVGERFTVISTEGDWCLVILKDETRGYIHRSRVVF